ncbi:hypothetical protein C8A01DRAFT_33644 [Parachaetomium inaequale]|uniref:Uncharacterized protein n=1 Tax=Parachaetomium inaequale TaxID=2588326 RepID=A0AAN6PPL9_9PEZI|nr:hypothetical protein C8A01DRAFT_33644 [Parachaetomium inaequale]
MDSTFNNKPVSIIEGGTSAAGFLARTPPADDLEANGAPRPWDPYFPPREIRSLRPFPVAAAGSVHVEVLQGSVRGLLQQLDCDWTLVSILGVHDLRAPGLVRPTIVIVLTPKSTSVEQAKVLVRRVLVTQELGIDDPFDVQVVEGDISLYNNAESIEKVYFPDRLSPGASTGSAQSVTSGTLGF